MGLFKNAERQRLINEALLKHPLVNEEKGVKKDYIKGLVFMALGDEEFTADEKEYVLSLMDIIDLDKNLLDRFEIFAKEPDENELSMFMDRIKKFKNELKLEFLVDLVCLAFKDGNFDEKEQELFDDYIEMLNLEDGKDMIFYLSSALINKNVDLAMLFAAMGEEFPFKYRFDALEMDIEKEFKSLFSWKWVKFELLKGNVEEYKEVSSKPISVRQFCVMLNMAFIGLKMAEKQEKKELMSIQKFFDTGVLEIGIDEKKFILFKNSEKSNISFEDGLFCYDEKEKNNPVLIHKDISIKDIFELFEKLIQENRKVFKVIADGSDIEFSEETKKYLKGEEKERFFVKTSYLGDIERYIDLDIEDYEEYGMLKNDECYTFRIMK